jgi:hypothetical protein
VIALDHLGKMHILEELQYHSDESVRKKCMAIIDTFFETEEVEIDFRE